MGGFPFHRIIFIFISHINYATWIVFRGFTTIGGKSNTLISQCLDVIEYKWHIDIDNIQNWMIIETNNSFSLAALWKICNLHHSVLCQVLPCCFWPNLFLTEISFLPTVSKYDECGTQRVTEAIFKISKSE